MSEYIIGSLISFILLIMGVLSVSGGGYNLYGNEKSKSGRQMFMASVCVFFWNFGYSWMSMCYDSDFAYVPRAIALLAVTFYMFYIVRYVGVVTDYPKRKLVFFLIVFLACSLYAWYFIIQKDAVTFTRTPWGYWYYSSMSRARIMQFACIMAAIVQYYNILCQGIKKTNLERQKYVLKQFMWFGPILFTGYLLDTLFPMLFHTAAIPGSCISAFFSTIILFSISEKNKVFGLSEANVSKYVFNDVRVPVVITNDKGDILLHNSYAATYFNQEQGGLDGHNISDYLPNTDEEIVKLINSDRECKLEKTEVRDDKFDTHLYTIIFVRDVTKEQEAYRVAEENRRIAEEASEAKSNFLANMSHEIRTPMNAIIGMSDILLDDETLSEDTLSKVEDIHTSGVNLLGIINDILDISKIESGKFELIVDEYEMASLINDVTTIIDARLYETSVKFNLAIDSSLPRMLKGDVLRIREILLNIAGNAVKFTHQGSIGLKVTWNMDESNPRIFFDISDTGIGIKDEDIENIFGSFTQVDTRKNRSIQGTGLGLAISKNLAQQMGGDITVESVYGYGSTFHICINQEIIKYEPIGDKGVILLVKRNYSTESRKKNIDIIQRPGKRVLLVDDVTVNLKVASSLIKKYGVIVDIASSGEEAIQKVQDVDYDIVFMDHMMPEMDGVEATHHIRALGGKYENLVIVALTANVLSEAKEMFEQEGLQDFLPKPIDLKLLDEIMNKWLPMEKADTNKK